jgi:replicative DNA helicase
MDGRGQEDGRSTDLGHLIGSLFPGQIALVAGPTGIGKTAALMSVALVNALAGVHVGYIPLEESQEELEVREGSALSWVDQWRIQSHHYLPGQEERVARANDLIRRLPLWFEWLPGGNSRDVASAVRDLIHRHGVKLVCIDYVQAIGGSESEYENIRASIGAIERAMGRDCCCYLGSQVNREGTKSGNPEAHHMRGAGTLEERARKVIVLSKGNREEHEIGDDRKPHLARREVRVAVKKNKGEEGEVFGWVHRQKGIFWPGYAPPPWVEPEAAVEPTQERIPDYNDPADRLPDDGGHF